MKAENGYCEAIVERRVSKGILGRGTESYRTETGFCSRRAVDGERLCRQHAAARRTLEAKLEAKRAYERNRR
jgi:hypothetical protein